MKILATAAAVLALTGCAGGAATRAREVTAEGWAPLGADGASDARRRALDDALRRAVEQGGGVEVAALTLTDDGAVTRERLSTTSRGVMDGYRVLSERREAGAVAVTVRAKVRQAPLTPRETGGWPPGTGPRLFLAGAGAPERESLLRAWRQRGGTVAPSAGEAELILSAEIDASAQHEPRVRPFVSWRARVRLTRADADGWTLTRETAALGLDAGQARERAVEEASVAVVAALAALPPTAWRAER